MDPDFSLVSVGQLVDFYDAVYVVHIQLQWKSFVVHIIQQSAGAYVIKCFLQNISLFKSPLICI